MKHLSLEQMNILKEKLIAEKSLLEQELGTVSVQDPINKADWIATDEESFGRRNADVNERADHFEEIDTNQAISNDLEERLREVNSALKTIETDSYGITEEGEEIPFERLQANPAAKTIVPKKN